MSDTVNLIVEVMDLDAVKSEIARLRAELEKAEASTEGIWRMYQTLIMYHRIAMQERDEARKWARYFYDLWNAAESSSLHNLRK